MRIPGPPDLLHATEGDWAYYVVGHDPEAILQIDELDELEWEPLWMHPIKASQCEDFGMVDWDPNDNVLRDPKTGRFEPRWFWIECSETHPEATAFLGVKYKPV